MVATTVAPLAASDKTLGSFFGAAMSEQAVMTAEAIMAVAMRRLRRVIGESPELREGGAAKSECCRAMEARPGVEADLGSMARTEADGLSTQQVK
jgi:hypothetical protein